MPRVPRVGSLSSPEDLKVFQFPLKSFVCFWESLSRIDPEHSHLPAPVTQLEQDHDVSQPLKRSEVADLVWVVGISTLLSFDVRRVFVPFQSLPSVLLPFFVSTHLSFK